MNLKNNKNILKLFFFGLILGLSSAALSEVNLAKDNLALTNVIKDQTAIKQPRLSFRFFAEKEQDQFFQDMLESSETLSRLEKQFHTNFKLDIPIYFHFQHAKAAQLIEAEIEANSHVVSIPYSFLYTLYQGLSTKYAQQTEVIERIFAATLEFYVWSEIAGIIIHERQLDILGKRSTAQDNFASIMMLNQHSASSDYLVDASEAYLLIHSLMSADADEDSLDELESDQKRYKHILCLTIGFDQLTQPEASETDHLTDFYLDKELTNHCQHTYLEVMHNWYAALTPLLQEDNLLNYWLNQQNLLQTDKDN